MKMNEKVTDFSEKEVIRTDLVGEREIDSGIQRILDRILGQDGVGPRGVPAISRFHQQIGVVWRLNVGRSCGWVRLIR